MLCAALAWLVGISVLSYLIPHLVVAWFYKTRDLKKAYNAEWAIVTGASSGIGKSLARRLAAQGLNVLLVALGDDLLTSTTAELKKKYPQVQFVAVPTDLSRPGYVDVVSKAITDKDVQVCFLNAGYVLTGFYADTPLEKQLQNLECNATSAVALAHVLTNKMLDKGLKGCLVFTSSAAAVIPSPFSVMYAATKAFLSAFGASLAPEVRAAGIDVLVVHPSPVASRFYDAAHKLDAMEFSKKFAVDPEDLPDTIFASIGRVIWRDIGPTAIAFRVLLKVLDYNFFAMITAWFGPLMPDFQRHFKPRHGAKKAN